MKDRQSLTISSQAAGEHGGRAALLPNADPQHIAVGLAAGQHNSKTALSAKKQGLNATLQPLSDVARLPDKETPFLRGGAGAGFSDASGFVGTGKPPLTLSNRPEPDFYCPLCGGKPAHDLAGEECILCQIDEELTIDFNPYFEMELV